jgi:hypothetical protein
MSTDRVGPRPDIDALIDILFGMADLDPTDYDRNELVQVGRSVLERLRVLSNVDVGEVQPPAVFDPRLGA